MNKNIKDIIILSLIAFGLFLFPTLINNSFAEKRTDTFYRRVNEDFGDCLKNANEDSREIRLCREIQRASELAFNSATQVSYSNYNISFTQTILFLLAVFLFTLKGRVEDLEKK
ncbi:MAG TPA: hypothetical protein VNB22_03475 [Pyrinomonadaceae bacterium]|nr:hypothetical protein [Pyrinomonadaceae bacterium]